MYFFIKKPSNLDFMKEDFIDEQIKKYTVCTSAGVSNSKLVIFEDNSIYLKNGSQYFKLTNNEMKKPTFVCKNTEGVYNVTEKLENKHFLHKE